MCSEPIWLVHTAVGLFLPQQQDGREMVKDGWLGWLAGCWECYWPSSATCERIAATVSASTVLVVDFRMPGLSLTFLSLRHAMKFQY